VPIVQVAGGLIVCALGWTSCGRKRPSPAGAARGADETDVATRAFIR